MAATKRQPSVENDQVPEKKSKEIDDDSKLKAFLQWCENGKLKLNTKVRVSRQGSCSNYGMVATDDIEEGEVLFEIPRDLLLSEKTSEICGILNEERENLESGSGWVPILLALMFEVNSEHSKWSLYLGLFPDPSQIELPMFWDRREMENELCGTGVPEMVKRDLEFIQREFNNIVLPFVKKYPGHFPQKCQDIEFYKKMVAFVMAYSFNEPVRPDNRDSDDEEEVEEKSPPFMVPMADILNHVAKNNAHLDFARDSLKMVALKPIKMGDEVYNTYGELPNAQLLQMYGFAEHYPNNVYDMVDISMSVIKEVLSNEPPEDDLKLAKEKWNYMDDIGQISGDGDIVLGNDGVLTDDDLRGLMKVIMMSKVEFLEHKVKDGWSDAEDDEDESLPLKFDHMKRLPDKWKQFLKRVCDVSMKKYNLTLQQLENYLEQTNISSPISLRKKYCIYVKYGQLKILQKFVDALI